MENLSLLPPDITLSAAMILIVSAFFTAGITTSFGLGGGVALLLIMAFYLPVSALIPLHGVVQMGANLSRATALRSHINWQIVLAFLAGGVFGAFLGAFIVISLPDALVKAAVALFVLYMVWGKVPALKTVSYKLFALCGFVATVLTMFFGATGPFVAALIKPLGLQRHPFVATHASIMSLQHGLKIVVFGFLGFAFAPYLGLLIAMLTAGLLGTWAGARVLDYLNEQLFARGFNMIMTLLALYLLYQSLSQISL